MSNKFKYACVYLRSNLIIMTPIEDFPRGSRVKELSEVADRLSVEINDAIDLQYICLDTLIRAKSCFGSAEEVKNSILFTSDRAETVFDLSVRFEDHPGFYSGSDTVSFEATYFSEGLDVMEEGISYGTSTAYEYQPTLKLKLRSEEFGAEDDYKSEGLFCLADDLAIIDGVRSSEDNLPVFFMRNAGASWMTPHLADQLKTKIKQQEA